MAVSNLLRSEKQNKGQGPMRGSFEIEKEEGSTSTTPPKSPSLQELYNRSTR
ncbi:hypothetical protein LguiA_001905 [Lonicera macranthoides]